MLSRVIFFPFKKKKGSNAAICSISQEFSIFFTFLWPILAKGKLVCKGFFKPSLSLSLYDAHKVNASSASLQSRAIIYTTARLIRP